MVAMMVAVLHVYKPLSISSSVERKPCLRACTMSPCSVKRVVMVRGRDGEGGGVIQTVGGFPRDIIVKALTGILRDLTSSVSVKHGKVTASFVLG